MDEKTEVKVIIQRSNDNDNEMQEETSNSAAGHHDKHFNTHRKAIKKWSVRRRESSASPGRICNRAKGVKERQRQLSSQSRGTNSFWSLAVC